MSELRGANLELMMIAAKFQHAYQLANRWLQYTNRQKAEAERKADTAVAALQVIVCRQRQQIEDFEQFEVELRKQKSALEGQLKKVCSENNSNKVEQLKSVIKTFESKLCGYEGNQSAVAHLQNKLQQAHELLDSMKLEKELALNELQQERSANTVHSNRIASLKSDYAAKREEAEHWQSRANKLKENVSSLFEEIQILRRENVRNFTELSASYKNVECQIESLNLELDKLKEENCQLSRKLMKNTQIACEMREGHHMTVEQLNKEVEKLKIENGCLKSHCQQECGSQNDQDAEWKQRYKEKCNEASVIYSELEAKNKETDEKNRLLQKRKEAIDFLSGKVAELETSIVEKDNLLKYLECNLRQFSKQCEECQVSLRNEMARTKQLEHHLSSAKERIATMTQVIDQLESEKDKLLEVLSKKVEAEKKQSCQEMTFATPGGNDKLAEQRKFSIKLAQKLRIYKEKLNTSLNHNRNLMETLNKLHSLNRVLLGAQQSGGQCPGGTWVGDPQGQLRGQQHLQSHPTPSYNWNILNLLLYHKWLSRWMALTTLKRIVCQQVDPCGTDGMFWPQIRFQVAESEESEHY
ncbi:hypothetical protein AAG570_001507 [Ranatra chinensis]|uniref:Uncharacterized protein n=1 Tax=Ranatra chinensis TaxID=642074 RepID=A0ABD0YX25_9HEMI